MNDIQRGDVVIYRFYTEPLDGSIPKLKMDIKTVRRIDKIPVYSSPTIGVMLNDYVILTQVEFTDFIRARVDECIPILRPFK